MTLKSLLKPLLLSLTLLPMLGSCSLFDSRPKTMTIEYDEEVKLHDGEMIWVHITRHYLLVGGGALGDPGAFEKGYMPKEVEISWDTGFEGVGRKSVYFDESVTIIDKYNGKWYVVGRIPTSTKTEFINNAINCRLVGLQFEQICITSLNQNGEFIKPNIDDVDNFNIMNIIHPLGINDWGSVPKPLDGTRITWNEKLKLEKQGNSFERLGRSMIVFNERNDTK